MKRITCFTESLGGGGAEHQITLLAGMLADRGYDVSLVTYASLPDHYETPAGVKRFDIGATKAKGKNTKAIIKAIKIFHYFLWLKTDCIISYRQCANLRVLLPMLLRSHRTKLICSERNITTTPDMTEKILFGGLYNRADIIVPNSHTQTKFIARYRPKLHPKLHTIINYTDIEQFHMSEVPQDTSVIKIAIFSRFSNQKNPLGLALALSELKSKDTRPFEVHWYGNQSGPIEGFNIDYLNLKKKIEELRIEDVLFLHPAVKNPAQYMDKYHAVALASYYEGFSNSVAEGVCCGKPMIVSDVSDNSVMVHNGENGFLFNPKQTQSICDSFSTFLNLSYNKMSQMAQRSREIAEELFDKDIFIQQYIKLIEE